MFLDSDRFGQFPGLLRVDNAGNVTNLIEVGREAPGEFAPGTAPKVHTIGPPRVSPNGTVVVAARFDDGGGSSIDFSNDTALYRFSDSIALIAQEGDPVPDRPGDLFKELIDETTHPVAASRSYDIDPNGEIVFADANDDARDDEDTGHGLYAVFPDETGLQRIVTIAREGDVVDIDPSPTGTDFRTIDMFPEQRIAAEVFRGALSDNRTVGFRVIVEGSPNPIFFETAAFVATLPGSACRADVNRNGTLGSDDFFAWVAAFGALDLLADQNGDGTVDSADFFAWVVNFAQGC